MKGDGVMNPSDKKKQCDEAFNEELMKTLGDACLALSREADQISAIALVASMSHFDSHKYGNRFYDVFCTIQKLSDQLAEDLNGVSNVLAMINGMDESALFCRKLPDDTGAELIGRAMRALLQNTEFTRRKRDELKRS